MAAMPDTVQCSTWCWPCWTAKEMLILYFFKGHQGRECCFTCLSVLPFLILSCSLAEDYPTQNDKYE